MYRDAVDPYLRERPVRLVPRRLLHHVQHREPVDDFPKHRVLAVEVRALDVRAEELRGVGVELTPLIDMLADKNWGGMRKWVGQNSDNDFNGLFRKLFDTLEQRLEPSSMHRMNKEE